MAQSSLSADVAAPAKSFGVKLGASMSAAEKYVNQGHPTIDELIVEQCVAFPRDLLDLLGDFWPEEESIDDFIRAMPEWRGHRNTDPAA
jgi:hypothetical protein